MSTAGHADIFAPPAAAADGRIELIGLDRAELAAELARVGEPPFRARQLWHWIYHRGATDFAAMTTLAKSFRADLAERYVVSRPRAVVDRQSIDGTRKWLLRFADGQEAETVHIPEEDRGTLCVSSQVGCTLTCRFCHTGTQRLVRNLSAAEILGQIMLARDALRRMALAARRAPHLQHRHDGHGRAALQLRQCRQGAAHRHGRRGDLDLQAQDHAVDRRRGADDPARRGRARRQSRHLAACGDRRAARPDRAHQQEISDRRADGRLPQLSRAQQCPAHHLRICDAEGGERFARPTPGRWSSSSKASRPRSI